MSAGQSNNDEILHLPLIAVYYGGINELEDEFTKCHQFSLLFSILAINTNKYTLGMEKSKERPHKCKLREDR